ncbi:glycosyltransferase family 2 protein [Azotobacter beijerinckii]|uniref:Glycosyltransferase involved in cell wall bisynthesis n=1 Tax=Azotobacter beijerinckii TaxID=170623 RepID=A0A1I4BLE0_9GAMM|nr:glycosyltransferase family 2 protein [Azotobacter beijerinckii]SFB11036.1 Glycosyltransferase involved in cell wall bisynthesis [Azotobacter beijerinckii]SFK69682.1 Glycosyltransferase involved in cell wall bisynthesis [Azotobacter beijerinckii]
MSSEKVSIIIPVYNVEQYLAECLNSAIRQDHDNIEIIAINDGSTDTSLSILEEFRTKHENIIVKSIPNQGLSVARNTGLEIATGEYILFLDSDDFIEQHTVSTCIEHFRRHRTDIVFFSTNVFFDGASEDSCSITKTERSTALQNESCSARFFFTQSIKLGRYQASACFYIYKKHKMGNITFYPKIIYEDNLFTTRLLLENDDIKVTCITDKLYNRRIRPESIMTQKKHENHVNGFLVVAEELLKLDLAKEKSETGAALNQFIQAMLRKASLTHRLVYDGRLSYRIRQRLIILYTKTRPTPTRIKKILPNIFPELLAIKKSIKIFNTQ